MVNAAHGEVRPFPKPRRETERCPRCSRWRLDGEDLYCALCGVSLFGVSLKSGDGKATQEKVILVARLNDDAARRRLLIENTSADPVSVQITPRHREIPGLLVEPSNLEVPAEGAGTFDISLHEEDLPDDLFVLREEYICRIDRHPRKVLSFLIEVKSGPRPELLAREVRFGRIVDGERGEAIVELANRGALPLVVQSVEAVGSAQLRVVGYPKRLDAGQRGQIRLVWDSALAEKEIPSESRILVRFVNYPDELSIPVRVQLERFLLEVEPSALRIDPAVPRHVYDHSLKLVNRGTIGAEVAAAESDQEWIVVERLEEPLVLAPPGSDGGDADEGVASERTLRVQIDPRGLEPGTRKGEVSIRDREGRALLTVPIELRVVAVKPYHDYIGIDFGTTNSVVAYVDPVTRGTRLVEVDAGGAGDPHLIPSVLTFRSGPEDYVIGYEARNEMAVYSDRTIHSVKRLLGSNRQHELFGEKFPPQAIAGRILRELVRRAEGKLLESEAYRTIERAIVTVPASFFDLQVEAILDACELAGLETDRRPSKQAPSGPSVHRGIIIDEPSAAALFYLSHLQQVTMGDALVQMARRRKKRGVHFLVFDYGGGTLDVSLARLLPLDGGKLGLTMLATAGNDRIGGDRIDLAILGLLLDQIAPTAPFDRSLVSERFRVLKRRAEAERWSPAVLTDVLRARSAWKNRAEQTKIELSSNDTTSTEVRIPEKELIRVEKGKVVTAPAEIILRIERSAIEERVAEFMAEAKALVERVLEIGATRNDAVDFILHTGRQSLMPAVRQAIRSLFSTLPEERDILEKDELKVCVAKGAVAYGILRETPGEAVQFLDEARRLPYSYGIAWGRGALLKYVPILEKGSVYPVDKVCELSADDMPEGGVVRLQIWKNRGTSTRIGGNPDLRQIGQARIDTLADDRPGCTLRFAVAHDRTLEVTADGQHVEVEDVPWEDDDDDWLG